jgi:hypothetical protein
MVNDKLPFAPNTAPIRPYVVLVLCGLAIIVAAASVQPRSHNGLGGANTKWVLNLVLNPQPIQANEQSC